MLSKVWKHGEDFSALEKHPIGVFGNLSIEGSRPSSVDRVAQLLRSITQDQLVNHESRTFPPSPDVGCFFPWLQ